MYQEVNQTLLPIEQAIKCGNIDEAKKLIKQIYKNDFAKIPNLIILACRNAKVEILKHLLANNGELLCQRNRNIITSPDVIDESQHNAFYYAIRSGNIELLNTLITYWRETLLSCNDFKILDDILSKVFKEIKLKNIPLSDGMTNFVESKLIDIGFFCTKAQTYQSDSKSPFDNNNIRERINFLIEIIDLLTEEYANKDEMNERFFYLTKSIAQNIHVLKCQLRPTYKFLPWEEIEFCLICFISSHTTKHEINIFYHSILSKTKLLKYLKFFSEKLNEIVTNNNIKNSRITVPRDEVVANIMRVCPQFKELYNDYQQLRDIYSLTRLNDYIKLTMAVDPKQKEGQLVIMRTFQILGEYFKNTLESPKLSRTTCAVLLSPLSHNTKKIIIGLRDSLAHAFSLIQRTNIENNTNISIFIGIQQDCKKLSGRIADILHKNKLNVISVLLKEILYTKCLKRYREISKTLTHCFSIYDINVDSFRSYEYEEIENYFAEIRRSVPMPTNYETELFQKVQDLLECEKESNEKSRIDFIEACSAFVYLQNRVPDEVGNYEITRNIIIKGILRNILCYQMKTEKGFFKELERYSMLLFESLESRMDNDEKTVEKIYYFIEQIQFITKYGKNDISYIKKLEEKLNEQVSAMKKKDRKTHLTNINYTAELERKLHELRNELNKGFDLNNITENCYISYKCDKQLQVIVEGLVLDILTILDASKTCVLESNYLSFDENYPLLTGKILRNHLAHDNVLVDLLITDPKISILLNANKLIREEIVAADKRTIGKVLREDLSKVKNIYKWGLKIINNQEKMFMALENGNIDDFMFSIENGADIFARCRPRMRTTLHFAAICGSLEIVEYLCNQNVSIDTRDIDSKTALHVAAEYGRTNVVEYFLSKEVISVDSQTEWNETCLHLAASKGHIETVECLLMYKANTSLKNKFNLIPAQKAVLYGHKDVFEILFGKKGDVDVVNTLGLLHLATESGSADLVSYLIDKGAKVNKMSSIKETPLHLAAQHGHLAIVNLLIKKEANVNLKDEMDKTALHFAAENGHHEIFSVLIKHNANINDGDVDRLTPLHYAIRYNHEKIVEICLNHGANAGLKTSIGHTPLHYAIVSGNLNVISNLLGHGVAINSKDHNGRTPLHFCCELVFNTTLHHLSEIVFNKLVFNRHNSKQIAELLLKRGADINARDKSELTPLHIASETGNIDVIEFLVKNGADIKALDKNKEIPLHKAARQNKIDAIKILIQREASVNAKNNDGLTPLYFAALNGCYEIVEYLLENKGQENEKENSRSSDLMSIKVAIINGHNDVVKAFLKHYRSIIDVWSLCLAAKYGHIDIAKILIENGVNVAPKDMLCDSPLCWAIHMNHLDIVKLLVLHGANVDGDVGEPIFLAGCYGRIDIFEYLLSKEACPNRKIHKDINFIHRVTSRGHKEIVTALIRYGVDVNSPYRNKNDIINNYTPLHFAVVKQDNEMIKILLEMGANINANTLLGTPLHLAVFENDLECVKVFMKSGKVEKNVKAHDDFTILHLAAQGGSLKMVKYVIENDFDIDARTSTSGSKPIHIAAKYGFKNIVEFLHQCGQCIDATNKLSQTLLHLASLFGHSEVIRYLIANNARINYQDMFGLTALHYAATSDRKNIVELLLNNGAIYNAMGNENETAFELTRNSEIKNLMISTGNLFEAVMKNNCSGVETSLKKGAIINSKNKDGFTPLHYALDLSFYDIVEMLLVNGASYDPLSDKSIKSIASKHRPIIDLLQQVESKNQQNGRAHTEHNDIKLDPNEKPDTADQLGFIKDTHNLFLKYKKGITAITNGNEQSLKEFIAKDLSVNKVEPEPKSILEIRLSSILNYAIEKGRTSIIKILLSHGADVVQETYRGNTPLHTAVLKNNTEIVDILLRHTKGIELKEFINAKNTTSGSTALFVAVKKKNSLDIVKLLLKYGAAYDITNQKGQLPLQLSRDKNVKSLLKLIGDLFHDCKSGNMNIIDVLNKLDAEEFSIVTNTRNNQGCTLLQISTVNKNKTLSNKLVAILKNRNYPKEI